MKSWIRLFRALANKTRLKIIVLLADGRERTVSSISREVHVTFHGTSRHLRLLSGLDILTDEGKDGHVYYRINGMMPRNARRALDLFLRGSKS